MSAVAAGVTEEVAARHGPGGGNFTSVEPYAGCQLDSPGLVNIR